MEQRPSGRRTRIKRKSANANFSIRADLLPLIVQEIDSWPSSPKVDYLRSNYLTKFVSKDTSPASTRKSRAIEKWLSQESVNRETNRRLWCTPPEHELLPGVSYHRFGDRVRETVTRIIGAIPPPDALFGAFSGGATTSRKRTEGHPALKYVGEADITESAMKWFEYVLSECPTWSSTTGQSLGVQSLRLVTGSHLFTVPKNADIDRVACKEPDINMYLQKGCGSFIRRRLQRVGINLNDQSRNQSLARQGSLDGSLATIDLSSASDSITCSLVRTLLPPAWFSLLNDLRSKAILIEGKWYPCEMFSSMGNGFTFEVESLLFYAIARAVTYFGGHQGVVSVYGDDIIIPTEATDDLITVLNFYGFRVNPDKSFWNGPIRESCGGHYYNGHDITPFFLRGPIKTIAGLIHFLNELRRWAARSEDQFLDELAWPLWNLLSELVPRRLWGGDVTSSGIFQLISPHHPRKRLAEGKSPRDLPVEGCYLLSLNGISDRKVETSLGREISNVTLNGKYYTRNAPRYGWHDSGMLFLNELT